MLSGTYCGYSGSLGMCVNICMEDQNRPKWASDGKQQVHVTKELFCKQCLHVRHPRNYVYVIGTCMLCIIRGVLGG